MGTIIGYCEYALHQKYLCADLWSAAADGRQIRSYAVASYRAVQFNADPSRPL
jgi:hypothetical protein